MNRHIETALELGIPKFVDALVGIAKEMGRANDLAERQIEIGQMERQIERERALPKFHCVMCGQHKEGMPINYEMRGTTLFKRTESSEIFVNSLFLVCEECSEENEEAVKRRDES